MGEFEWIRHLWEPLGRAVTHPAVRQGIGDDGARLVVPAGHELVLSVDTLVEGGHFLPSIDPRDLGWRALAVNLSDLAAMGATPVAYTLALTCPGVSAPWFESFAAGLEELSRAHGIQLVGGDMTRGPLTLTLQVHGIVPENQALLRSGAGPGDLICVSGDLGAAAEALNWLESATDNADVAAVLARYHRPEPRVALGEQLRGQASAAIDISDGLLSDLGHVLRASGVGAEIDADRLPLNPAMLALAGRERALELALGGGDDYELCFTWPGTPATLEALLGDEHRVAVIGRITADTGLKLFDRGEPLTIGAAGHDHFRE